MILMMMMMLMMITIIFGDGDDRNGGDSTLNGGSVGGSSDYENEYVNPMICAFSLLSSTRVVALQQSSKENPGELCRTCYGQSGYYFAIVY